MLGLFFGFNGRINRTTYWLGNMVVGFVGFFGVMFGIMLAGTQGYDKTTASALRILATMGLTVGPVMLAMSWASLALQVKRFHDRGRSGILTMIPLVPVAMMVFSVFQAAAMNLSATEAAARCLPYMNILFLINLAFFVDLGCLPSKPATNKYGDPPKGGFGMGPTSPTAPAMPGRATPAPAQARVSLPTLGGADAAMQRAIAEQAKAKVAPQPPMPPRAAPAMATARPAMAPAGAPTGFGRKPAR